MPGRRFTYQMLAAALAAAIGLSACGSPASSDKSDEQVRLAIESYLASRGDLGMPNLQVFVERVDYDGASASAAVTISARTDAKATMQMVYRLRREDGQWRVEPSSSDPGQPPGAAPGASGMPPGHPGVGGQEGAAPELPQGHPPIAESPAPSSEEVPSNHPPIQ